MTKRLWKTINTNIPHSPKSVRGPVSRAEYDALVTKVKQFLDSIEDAEDVIETMVLENELRTLVNMPSIEEKDLIAKNGPEDGESK